MDKWIDSLPVSIGDRRSIRDIVNPDEYTFDDIKRVLEHLRIKNAIGVRALTIAIIQQAVDDLDSLDKRVKLLDDCCKKGELSKLTSSMLPFTRDGDKSAVIFFDSDWGRELLDLLDLEVLPLALRQKIGRMKKAQYEWDNHCAHCVSSARKINKEKIKENLA
jgi:hypothetical protein